MLILVINPGSTSTKIAVYEDEKQILKKNISHSIEELSAYENIIDQYEFRKNLVVKEVNEAGIPFKFDAVIGRGGLAKPVEGGVYEINQRMIDDTRATLHHHACNLGCIISFEIAKEIGCRSFIANPVLVDELCDYARVSGSPLMPRKPIWHALNQKAIARRFAKDQGKRYEEMDIIVCHLGGGISVAVHQHGRAVDVSNALDGEGPFSPERAGTLPAGDLVHLCFSGKYTQAQIEKMIAGQGGLAAHLGTNDMRLIEQWVNEGNEKAKFLVDAMIYHVAKEIASKGAVLCGKVDAILFTGGIAHWKYVVDELCRRVDYLAPTYRYPGEDELEALSFNALSVLRGEREAKEYV
ncbi:MAG: butyrate kinase [Prevotella sp.]|uniref:butyrate kinase n=1 Tax=Prevotella sp. Rep29 TaxID=2691580 RepID=UPI001B4A1C7D|nr:butyrate kinase [Prevotella sp. Rep29]MBP3834707.1 butyrate kinase [Prevotella sp.]MBR1655201.1 butyrate kinase [Prevotella sp.]MBR3390379.1 butyrate kinase [Prevotella sp.]MBR3444526.1 butyrate kinase [Prevotella sp.]MBR7013348.1 butyrate kinase [Prevotella sp.]